MDSITVGVVVGLMTLGGVVVGFIIYAWVCELSKLKATVESIEWKINNECVSQKDLNKLTDAATVLRERTDQLKRALDEAKIKV